MRGIGVIAALALSSCYDPRTPSGAACTTTCPSGEICIDGVCRTAGTPTDDAPSVDMVMSDSPDAPPDARPIDATPDADVNPDLDGDGVPNAMDNCPTLANADQHDEDSDARGDTCDLCPHVADQGNNLDNDGVADACDPHPMAAGDAIAFFDPFTTVRPEWFFQSGFTVANDRLTVNATGFKTAALERPIGNSVLEIGGSIASWGASTPHKLSVTFGDSTRYHYCEWYQDSPLSTAKAALSRFAGGDYMSLDTMQLDALAAGEYTISALSDDTNDLAACRMQAGIRDDRLDAATTVLVGDHIEIDVQNANVAIDYFIQISW